MNPLAMSPADCYRSLCELSDPVRSIAILPALHVRLVLAHLDTLPETGVPGLFRPLCEERAAILFRRQNPLPSSKPLPPLP